MELKVKEEELLKWVTAGMNENLFAPGMVAIVIYQDLENSNDFIITLAPKEELKK